ncbi:GIY-YIG nuclease family protein [Polaromonas sp. P1(28)-13]|nr:GIY-YIG nuclease family protein [Polaromonas sp. P1(28)-13]
MNDVPKVSGVYSILNLSNGRHYIGSSFNIRARWQTHVRDLKAKTHHAIKLQNGWNKHGALQFRLDILELANKDDLQAREQFYIDSTHPFYNTLRNAFSARGYKHTEDQLTKMSAAGLARWSAMSEEQRLELTEKFRQSRLGMKASDETRRKVGDASRGRKHTEETKRVISQTHKGRKRTAEHQAKLAATVMKSYVVTSPQGETIEVTNLTAFCRERGLVQSRMAVVATGRQAHYKGWLVRPGP